MIRTIILLTLIGGASMFFLGQARAQDYSKGNAKPLFSSHELIRFTLKGNLHTTLCDIGDDNEEHQALLEYPDGGDTVRLNIKIETRGHFRRDPENCYFPPVKLNFKKKQVEGTWFEGLDKVKLVTHCRPKSARFQNYVLEEYLIYRHYNIITDTSFRVRLAMISYEDQEGKRSEESYAFFIESDDAFEDRFDADEIKEKYMLQDDTQKDHITKLAVFQYMIGNTDWAVTTLHNIKLFVIGHGERPFAIPYDFDWSGLINTVYARPLPRFGTESVSERVYRGYCRSLETYQQYFAFYDEKKEDIYNLYQNFELLKNKERKRIIKYLDDFYDVIHDKRRIDAEFIDRCLEEK